MNENQNKKYSVTVARKSLDANEKILRTKLISQRAIIAPTPFDNSIFCTNMCLHVMVLLQCMHANWSTPHTLVFGWFYWVLGL